MAAYPPRIDGETLLWYGRFCTWLDAGESAPLFDANSGEKQRKAAARSGNLSQICRKYRWRERAETYFAQIRAERAAQNEKIISDAREKLLEKITLSASKLIEETERIYSDMERIRGNDGDGGSGSKNGIIDFSRAAASIAQLGRAAAAMHGQARDTLVSITSMSPGGAGNPAGIDPVGLPPLTSAAEQALVDAYE